MRDYTKSTFPIGQQIPTLHGDVLTFRPRLVRTFTTLGTLLLPATLAAGVDP